MDGSAPRSRSKRTTSELLVQDRPVQAGPPEVGRDVGVQAAVKEPAHDLGPAVLAGVDERLGHDLLRIGCRRDPGWDREEVGGVGARRRGVGPQPAVRIEAGPDKIQPAAGGIGPERLRDDAVFGEQVDHLCGAAVDGVLQRGDAARPGAGVGAAPSSRRTYSTRLELAAGGSGRSRLVALPISTSTAARGTPSSSPSWAPGIARMASICSRVSACSAVSWASRPVSPASRASASGRRRRHFSWRSSRSRWDFSAPDMSSRQVGKPSSRAMISRASRSSAVEASVAAAYLGT